MADSYCALLVGYVLASSGDRHGADAAFDYAASLMTLKDRCAFLDIRVFLDSENRDSYEKLPCPAQDAINTRFWWLADPLFMQPGNERRAVHLYRETLILLHSAVTVDERFDWRVKVGGSAVAEMILRYGWPAVEVWNRDEDNNHFQWLGFRDSSVNASREYFRPRFHTTPTYATATDLRNLTGQDLADVAPKWNPYRETWEEDWWPIEHFARDGPLGTFDYQVAAFRRTDGALVALATDPRSGLASRFGLAAIHGRACGDERTDGLSPTRLRTGDAGTGRRRDSLRDDDTWPASPFRRSPRAGPRQRSSGEGALCHHRAAWPRGDEPARSWHFGSRALCPAGPTDSLPRSATEAIGRMLPSTDLGRAARVGVFFEVYGLERGDEADLTLKVLQQDQAGFLRRVGARLGILDLGDGSILMHWRDQTPGVASTSFMIGTVPVQSRAIVLDFAQLKPGHYALEIGVGRPGESPAVSRREFTIKEK